MSEFSRRDLIAASRMSLQVFAERALYELIPGYKHFRYVDLMGAYLEALIGGEMSRLIINLPPRHGKTLYCAALSAFFLGKFPGLEVLNVSHSQTLAKYLSQQTFDLMETAFYKEVFPNTRIRGDRRSAGDFRTTASGGRLGVTVDSSITGRGADLIIIDDPLSAQDAFSEQIRENLKNSFDSMVATRLNDHTTGRILLVAHRLHEDDLTGHLLKKGYLQLSLPFEAKEDERHEFRGVTYTRTEGVLLQPTRFPPAALARLKAEMPAHHYATQYQQVPTAAGSGMVRRADFPLVDELPRGGETIISWDTASSLGPAASYSVALVFQLIGDVSYFRHIFRQRVVYEELKSSASSLHQRFKPSIHLVEAASLGKALAAEIRSVGGNAIELSPGNASKVARLEAQLHRIKSQSVQILAGLPGLEDLLNEITVFPHAASDDQVDALTQYLSWWTERGEGNAKRSVLVAPRAGLNTRMGVIGGIMRANGLPTRRWRF